MPGQSEFYTSQELMNIAGRDATVLFQGLQVHTSAKFPLYWPGMTLYKLSDDLSVAVSYANANPGQGAVGGFVQYFIPDFRTNLQPIETILLINR